MWSFSRVISAIIGQRISAAALGAVALATLGACSFTPLYGNGANGQKLVLSYAEPTSRAEQIIYQQLGLRLGQSAGDNAPLVTLTTTIGGRSIGRSATGLPINTGEVTVGASVRITQISDSETNSIETLYQVTREASATYTTNGQRLADQQAFNDATARAALAVGDTLSLLIRAKLSQ